MRPICKSADQISPISQLFSPSRVISPLPLFIDSVSFVCKMLLWTGHQNKYCGVLKEDCAKEEKRIAHSECSSQSQNSYEGGRMTWRWVLSQGQKTAQSIRSVILHQNLKSKENRGTGWNLTFFLAIPLPLTGHCHCICQFEREKHFLFSFKKWIYFLPV